MKLFNGSKKLKDELIKQFKAHQNAPEYIHGDWYKKDTSKAFYYGYTMKTKNNVREKFAKKYSIDLWYVYLTEKIFKNLPKGEFENYPLESIEVFLKDGELPKTINWNKIKSEFFYKLLDNRLKYCKKNKLVTDYVKKCRDLFLVLFNEIDEREANSISDAVLDATYDAYNSAANDDAAAAYADSYSANDDAAAAYADFYSANDDAAADAVFFDARKNHYIWMRDLLFKCVKNNITF